MMISKALVVVSTLFALHARLAKGQPWEQAFLLADSMDFLPRSNFAFASDGTTIYCFGGTDDNMSYFNDLVSFVEVDTGLELPANRFVLQEPTTGLRPSPRIDATMAKAGNDYLGVFGGFTPTDGPGGTGTVLELASDTSFLFNLGTNEWVDISTGGPSPRSQAASYSDGNDLYVIGGFNIGANGVEALNDYWKYSPSSGTWSEVQILPPIALFGAQAIFYNSNVYLYGGFIIENGTPVQQRKMYRRSVSSTFWDEINPLVAPVQAYGIFALAPEDFFYYYSGSTTGGDSSCTASTGVTYNPTEDNFLFDQRVSTWSSVVRPGSSPPEGIGMGGGFIGPRFYSIGGTEFQCANGLTTFTFIDTVYRFELPGRPSAPPPTPAAPTVIPGIPTPAPTRSGVVPQSTALIIPVVLSFLTIQSIL